MDPLDPIRLLTHPLSWAFPSLPRPPPLLPRSEIQRLPGKTPYEGLSTEPNVAGHSNILLSYPPASNNGNDKMDIHRGTTSIALPFTPSPKSHFASKQTTSRIPSHSPPQHGRPREAMAIPGTRIENVPPPLPPPRYNEDLANGHDIAWHWGNNERVGGIGALAPIRPGSSLLGGPLYQQSYHQHYSGRSRSHDEDEADDMDLDDEDDRRGSAITIHSVTRSEAARGNRIPHLVRRAPSPSTLSQR